MIRTVSSRITLIAAAIWPAMLCADEARPENMAAIEEVLEVTSSITLDPQKTYGRIVVKASHIAINGNGAWLVGNSDLKSKQSTFTGTGITLDGVTNVTIRNLNARGWETGLHAKNCNSLTIEECNFSNNFHDPDFGWGENGRRGGIVFEQVDDSRITHCRANQVWDACVLVDSDNNTIRDNDFSFTSNTCLKLWTSCRNVVDRNNLSHGIRISPGEVHARDSTCVLIESGSNHNNFLDNDCTFGGDGIFIRVLNGWCSTDNTFTSNDCSWANNNAIECWAPRNTFIRNKANHSSYGFWMGGSDQTRLIGNEASYNGLAGGQHNSPHLPESGHAGIVFMFGSASHIVARDNICRGNNGAGIALIGDLAKESPKWKAYHWLLERNVLESNRWGIYAKNADWIVATKNEFRDQSVKDVQLDGNVSRWKETDATAAASTVSPAPLEETNTSRFQVQIEGPRSLRIGETGTWAAKIVPGVAEKSGSFQFEWDADLGMATGELRQSTMTQAWTTPGLHRIGVNVTTETGLEIASQDVYVTRDVEELGTEQAPELWHISDFQDRRRSQQQASIARFTSDEEQYLVGRSSLHARIEPYAGFRVALTCESPGNAKWGTTGKNRLSFWLKSINSDVTGWQGGPFIVLHGADGTEVHIEPQMGRDFMRDMSDSEVREGWRLMEVPLSTTDTWKVDGMVPEDLQAISIAFDSWGAPPLDIWLDGLALE